MTLALLAVAGLGAKAQQLPNGSFDEGNWVDCVPWTSTGNTSSQDKQPVSWTISNVKGLNGGGTGATTIGKSVDGRSGTAVCVTNTANSISTDQIVPGYFTLGTTWSTAKVKIIGFTTTEKDGGTFGGIEFAYKPDALRFYYKRSCTGTNTRSSVIAYLWNGSTSQENVPGVNATSPKKVTMTDRDINVLNMSTDGHQGGNVTYGQKLIAKLESYTTEQPTEWTECTIPFEYVSENSNETPEKINVIFAASDYFNSENVTKGVSLSIDDVSLVYYHSLTSASYNGMAIDGVSEESVQREFNLSDQVYNEYNFEYTVKGAGATVDKSYDQNTGVLTVTVKGNDYDANPSSKTVYTFQFKKVVYSGLLSGITVNGQSVNNFDEANHYYTVVGDYTDNCVVATAKNDDFTQESYDADTRICHISVLGGSEEGKYYVKFAKATTDYKGKMTIAMEGSLLSAATSTVGITAPADGKADFQLLGFSLEGLGLIGDIFVTDVPYAEKDGVVTLHKEQTINIFGETGASLGDLPVVLNGTQKDGNLTANIDITWMNMPINVSLIPLNATCLDLSKVKTVDLSSTPIDNMKADMTNRNFMIILPEGTEGAEGDVNVVVGSKCADFNLFTDDDFGVPTDFTATTVWYDRVFSTHDNYVQSFVLPFGFTVPAGTTVAKLSSVNGDNLVFKPVTETVANKPYLVVTTDKDFINKLTNVEVKATTGADLTTTVDGVSHIGSYTTQSVAGVYGYAEGQFVKANSGTVKPFRTYIKVADSQAAPKAFSLSIDNGNGTVTAISHATTAATAKDSIYNLQGVRVNGDLKHLTKGVYIVNGQKVVVK